MSSDRPQYGEYATPEQQRAAAGLPPLDQVTPEQVPLAPASAVSEPGRPRPFDRFLTIVLLAFGVVNVIASVPGFLDLSSSMDLTLETLGLEGEFTNFAAARTWGTAAAAVMITGYMITAWLSIRRLKAQRSAFWVPLVGFVVAMLIVSVCVSVPMLGDPAFLQGLVTPPAG